MLGRGRLLLDPLTRAVFRLAVAPYSSPAIRISPTAVAQLKKIAQDGESLRYDNTQFHLN